MKGFASKMKDGYKMGLRPSEDTYRNSGVLISGMNCLAMKTFLKGYSPAIADMPGIYVESTGALIDLTPDWPFPQIFKHDTGLYIGNRVGIYLVEYSATYGLKGTHISASYAGSINWPWTFVDCPGYPMFASGDVLVYYDADLADWAYWAYGVGGAGGDAWDETKYQPVCMCYHMGQIFAGGAKTHTTYPSQSRQVLWSQIGALKWLTVPTTHDEMQDAVKNTAGFLFENADEYGTIQRILPFGKGVVVYGSESVFGLTPVVEPVPAFAITLLHDRGITNPLAAAASRVGDRNLFVDTEGVLCLLQQEAGQPFGKAMPMPKKLGHDEFLDPMQDSLSFTTGEGLISILHNKAKDEWYIGNKSEGYVYNGIGLTPIDKSVSGLVDFRRVTTLTGFGYPSLSGAVYGYGYQREDEGFSMQTDIFDMSLPGIKAIESLYLGMDMAEFSYVECMIEWRVDKGKPFRSTKWVRVGPNGMVSPMVAGVDFRLNVRSNKWSGLQISDITINYKVSDKSGIRGVYSVGDTSSGAGA